MKELGDVLDGWFLTEFENLFYTGLGLQFGEIRFPAAIRSSLSDVANLRQAASSVAEVVQGNLWMRRSQATSVNVHSVWLGKLILRTTHKPVESGRWLDRGTTTFGGEACG